MEQEVYCTGVRATAAFAVARLQKINGTRALYAKCTRKLRPLFSKSYVPVEAMY